MIEILDMYVELGRGKTTQEQQKKYDNIIKDMTLEQHKIHEKDIRDYHNKNKD